VVLHQAVIFIGVRQDHPIPINNRNPGAYPSTVLADIRLKGGVIALAEATDRGFDQQGLPLQILLQVIQEKIMTRGGRQPGDQEHGENKDPRGRGKNLPEKTDITHGHLYLSWDWAPRGRAEKTKTEAAEPPHHYSRIR